MIPGAAHAASPSNPKVCQSDPQWRLTRRGDATVSWACDADLDTVCHRLQRDWEITELVVVQYRDECARGEHHFEANAETGDEVCRYCGSALA